MAATLQEHMEAVQPDLPIIALEQYGARVLDFKDGAMPSQLCKVA